MLGLKSQDIIQTGVSHSDRIARQQLAQELKNLLASEPPPLPPHTHKSFITTMKPSCHSQV